MDRIILFEGEDIKLVARGNVENKAVCCTFFTFATNESTLMKVNGFGEEVLVKYGFSALHFINLKNHWWQTPEMDIVLKIAKEYLEGSAMRVGYGASMGGYGALKFASCLRFECVLSFSPQYSVDEKKVPWEKRWKKEAAKLNFFSDSIVLTDENNAHIFFDPDDLDSRHAELIAELNPVKLHPIKDAGHQVIRVFSELGLLQSLICAALNSDRISYIDLFEQRKYLSYTLNMTISYRTLDQISLAAVNRALDLKPNDPSAMKRKDFIVANL